MGGEDEGGAVTFMGRVMQSLLHLTDPSHSVYAPESSAWFLYDLEAASKAGSGGGVGTAVEQCGVRTFSLLERSLGTIGLQGLNRLLAFRTVHALNTFLRYYETKVHPFRTLLDQIRTELHPEHKLPNNASKLYTNAVKKVEHLLLPVLRILRKVGQGQLLRRQIAHMLCFSAQLDAHLLYQALDTFNR